MYPLMLTKSTTFIIGPVAEVLGLLMNGIFWVLDKIGIPNIGLSIIFFTIIIYMALMPLTVKQQKFSKLQSKMTPEINKIQAKYKNRKDQDSMMKQNEEMQAVYKKYGVSASGSCVQLIIQMPILFALYQVIYKIPAYVTQVKDAFFPLVTNLISQSGAIEYLQKTTAARSFANQFTSADFTGNVGSTVSNTLIDVLNKFSTAEWTALADKFPSLGVEITNTTSLLTRYNNFLGLNMGDSPWFAMKTYWAAGVYGLAIASVVIPVLSAVTQWINIKLMPQQQATGNQQQDSMMNSMKTMNLLMPLMSAYFCFTLPAGMGLYWVAGAVIRSVQQVFINKHIDKMDIDAMIAKNLEKQQKKIAKSEGRETVSQRMMNQYSQMNTKSIESGTAAKNTDLTQKQKDSALRNADRKYENKTYRKDSMAAKVNMVRDFNDTSSRQSDTDSGKEDK